MTSDHGPNSGRIPPGPATRKPARLRPDDIRDVCLYTCDVKFDGPDVWTGFLVTHKSADGRRATVVPLDPDDPAEIPLKLRREKLSPPGRDPVILVKYKDAEGQSYYSPDKTRELIAWELQCERDGKVREAVNELILARRILELGDRLIFDEVRPGVFKMRGFEVYATTWEDRDKVADIARGLGEYRNVCGVDDLDEARDFVALDPENVPAVFTVTRTKAEPGD